MGPVRRPESQRAWSVLALVIVLAALRRGDPPVAVGGEAGPVGREICPSGQVVAEAGLRGAAGQAMELHQGGG